jgi:hypothetical protein
MSVADERVADLIGVEVSGGADQVDDNRAAVDSTLAAPPYCPPVPVPVPIPMGREAKTAGNSGKRPELDLLIAEHEAGRGNGVAEVALGDMPEDATPDDRAVAADLAYLMGLRLAVYDDRPLPYATTYAAKRLGWGENHKRASRALHRLCDAGVIRPMGSMPERGKFYGTKLYSPPLPVAPAGGDAVELQAVGVEAVDPVAVEPNPEVSDQGRVKAAVLVDVERHDRGAATGDRADSGISHGMKATEASG